MRRYFGELRCVAGLLYAAALIAVAIFAAWLAVTK